MSLGRKPTRDLEHGGGRLALAFAATFVGATRCKREPDECEPKQPRRHRAKPSHARARRRNHLRRPWKRDATALSIAIVTTRIPESAALAALRALYAEADALYAGWSCPTSRECCHFGITGREPYVTAIELLAIDVRWRVAAARSRRNAAPCRSRATPHASASARCSIATVAARSMRTARSAAARSIASAPRPELGRRAMPCAAWCNACARCRPSTRKTASGHSRCRGHCATSPRCARASRRSAADTVHPPAPARNPPRRRGSLTCRGNQG